jgi:Fe-S-cluster containining protein
VKPVVQRFACTQCGKCCNRSPGVELSEAAALADVFVFRLLFRLYWLPQRLNDYLALGHRKANASAAFYEKKRLLDAFAARKYPVKLSRNGRAVEYNKYLTISALALDTSPGACNALRGKQCGIYHRRPLTCRSVPIHYSRAEAQAETDLMTFVETPGYECDTGATAQVVLDDGRIVAPEISAARIEALAAARRDRRWGEAIVRRMNQTSSASRSLPSLQEIETSAQIGALTTSMRMAWQIAADVALITAQECDRLVELQLQTIGRDLAQMRCTQDTRQTLTDMQAEYRHHRLGDHAIRANG